MTGSTEKVFPDMYLEVRGTPKDPDLEHDGTKPYGYGMFWSQRPGAPLLVSGDSRRKRGIK